MPRPPRRPDSLEAALLILKNVQGKESEGAKLSRFRISETTLERICDRRRIPDEYFSELQEWLFKAGWALFFAGSTYAMIKISTVEAWARLGTKRISSDLEKLSRGEEYNFEALVHLLKRTAPSDDEEPRRGNE
jgi:hypothetical protein